MSVSSISVFDRLDADWSITRRSRTARIALHRWKTVGEHTDVFAPFDNIHDIDDVPHATTNPEASDRLLAPLLQYAHDGDELAARIVLQAFVPLAASLTSGRKLTVAGIDYQFEVIEALSEMIAEFPVDTRHDPRRSPGVHAAPQARTSPTPQVPPRPPRSPNSPLKAPTTESKKDSASSRTTRPTPARTPTGSPTSSPSVSPLVPSQLTRAGSCCSWPPGTR